MTINVLPGGLPLLGHAVDLLRRPLEFVEQLRDTGSVVRFNLGPRPAYLISTPDLMKELLITKSHCFDKGGPLFKQSKPLLGNGLVGCDREQARRARPLMQPAFHHSRLARYTEVMAQVSQEIADEWVDGSTVDFDALMNVATMDALTRCLFAGVKDTDTAAEVRAVMQVIVNGVGRRAFIPISFVHKLPLPPKLREDAAMRELHRVVDNVIAEYRRGGVDHGDLMSMMMMAQDDTGTGMTDTQLHDEVRSMMVAGTETSATMLLWMAYALHQHPDIRDRMHEELDLVLAGRRIDYEDMPKLEYTGRVVQEALRMYPVAWLLTRYATTDVELDGVHIPAGADVMFSPYALHMDPRNFDDPRRFDPDRWLPERARSMHRQAFLPFGAGVRKCIGESFAFTEMMIMVATFFGSWNLTPVHVDPEPLASTTYRPRHSHFVLSRR
ncbi:cytochrome P450 [Kutzneria kofuensis]|uniref:Pentalenene oxygenase n=1 Tax=Kutzneria kofuensis TaxID=103725 RepID=A0A7W9NEI2_9PSEU|nr:cytochrome P450 [Kutzneria kofuensis]MBB5889434.1 pentalenene oxygenase [Kutzneria kofuensis]